MLSQRPADEASQSPPKVTAPTRGAEVVRTVRAAPRIPRDVIKAKRQPNPKRAALHLAFVRDIGICLACGISGPTQAAHVRRGTDGGTGTKPSDKYAVPLCPECHVRQHRVGEVTFWGELGVDPLDVACRLWTVSGDAEQGRRCIERARARITLHQRQRA